MLEDKMTLYFRLEPPTQTKTLSLVPVGGSNLDQSPGWYHQPGPKGNTLVPVGGSNPD